MAVGRGWLWGMAVVRFALLVVGLAVVAAGAALAGVPEPFLVATTAPTALMLVVNLVTLALLARGVRREGGRLRDLIGYDRARLPRDALLALAWFVLLNGPFVVVVVLMTVVVAGRLDGDAFAQVFAGRSAEAYAAVEWPLWWAILVSLSFALLNPVVEEMHYRGYLQPRLIAMSGSVAVGVGVTAAAFALQHVAYASTLPGAVVYVAAFLVWGAIAGMIMLRVGRLPSLIIAHFVVNASFAALPIVLALTSA